jgi:hypothetical protein
VQKLQMGELRQAVRIESSERPADERRGPAPRPSPDEEEERPSCQREACDQHEVVGEDGAAAERQNRHRHHALDDHRFGIRERQVLRIEDVGVE